MSRYDSITVSEELSPEAIQSEVERILASEKFSRSKRLRSLLRFTVAQTLQGNADTLKEYVIGTEVLKKPDSYDPRSDSLVRVLASRLRVKLKEYYNDGGSEDPLVIEFPKGKYVPKFQRREALQTEVEKKLRARDAYSFAKFLAVRSTDVDLAESVTHFQESVEADPAWALAPVGLASSYAFQALLGFRRPREVWPLVRNQTENALLLDPMSSEAHVCLGMERAFFDWRWRDADSHFQKAIERDSYSGGGHLWRALACHIPTGNMAAAQEEIAQAQQFAPCHFLEEGTVLTLYLSEQYEQVLQYTESRLGNPQQVWMPWLRACALAALERTKAAVNLLEGIEPEDRVTSTLGYIYGLAGETDKAGQMLTQLREKRDRGAWVSNYGLALIENGLGDRNAALALLQEALREKEPWMVYLSVDPRMASLRSMPKFAGFARRILFSENESGNSQSAAL